MKGMSLPGVLVDVMGPTQRMGETTESGLFNMPGIQPGTYRLRFSGKEVTTFEKEVSVRAGQIVDLDVPLSLAPPPPAPPPAPPAPEPIVITKTVPPPLGPAGQPLSLSVVDVIEKERVGRQPRLETLLSCTGNLRVMIIQLNEPLPDRLYEDADASYYVVAGEGTVRRSGKDVGTATSGSFVSVPRGTSHSFTRRGNRPFVLLATLSGEPCEQAK
jgi:mannose-6-phosphate isomerase-like protein (cupin superfamily)